MENMAQVKLKENEKKALQELRERLLKKFPGAEIILYGSKTRGDDEEFSDIDVLILLDEVVNNSLEEEIFSAAFQSELKYDVIFGITVYSKNFWNSKFGKGMPFHWNIDKEGILIKEL